MNRLLNWFTLIIKKQKGLKRWQRVVTVLAAMITFATTYALILPAITVEKNSTEDVGGMYLEKTAKRDDLLEDNALEPVGVSIAADMDNAVSFAYSDDDMTATAIFSTDEIIPEGAELVVNNVTSDSEEYADLSGRAADLLDKEFIYDVTSCSFYDFALVCDNVDVTPKTGMVDIQIIFRNNTNQHVNDVVYVGRFARPSEDADGFAAMAVSTVEAEAEADDTVSMNGTAVNDNSAGESGNPLVGEDELVSINIDESSVIELSDGIITSLSLKGSDLSRSDSLVGIIAGYVDEEIKAAAAETDAEIPEYDESQDEDASANADNNVSTSPEEDSSGTSAEDEKKEITDALQMKTLKASGRDYTVTLTYDESSKIPEGASLTVSEISKDSKEYQTYLEETKKAMGLKEEETLPGLAARFFDIKIMVGGKEFNPESGVSVEITYAEPLAEHSETEVNAVHFADEKAEAEMIEANTAEVQADGKTTVEFTAESFSVYGVIYTVDFHYEVNGKMYEFSIPGGGFASFYKIVEVLGISNSGAQSGSGEEIAAENSEIEAGNGENTDGNAVHNEVEEAGVEDTGAYSDAISLNNVEVSESTREFVADVASVEFSSPELVWVGKIEDTTTVGGLKEANGLEVQYSAELTEEQIAEINGTVVESGDWALISMLPFTSEESLTVTMKNGDQFVVRVTDAQKPYKDVESLENGTYIIYNSFDSSKQAVFMKNDGTSYFTNTTTGVALNATDLSDYTWNVTKNSDGTFTIKSTKNNIYVNLWGNDHNTKDQFASATSAKVTLATESSGISISYGNKMLQRRTSGSNAGFYVHSSTYGKTPLTFYKIENNPSGGTSGEHGIEFTDDERAEFEKWKETLEKFNTLTDYDKTAEVYNADNRIFKIDITADSGITDFYENVDLGFVLDVSNSMKFPSSLKALEDTNGDEQQVWMTADWLNWAKWAYSDYYDQDGCFYILSDPALTSTIYKVFLDGTQWKYQDASENPGVKVFDINDGTVFKEPFRQAYTLYYADDKTKRMTYLQNSVTYAINTLKKIVTPTDVVDDQTATVQVAYNYFAGISSSNGDSYAIRGSRNFVNLRSTSASSFTVSPAGNEASGTRQDLALYDTNNDPNLAANEFGWHSGYDQYLILVTDGAPNGATMQDVVTAASNLKTQHPNVKIFTIGLSTKDVDGGSQMLKSIADDVDGDGVPEFYEAEKAHDLEYILLKILQTIMAKGLVKGTITDTIDSAFYPVDSYGNPITPGKLYDQNGSEIGDLSTYIDGNGTPIDLKEHGWVYNNGWEWGVTADNNPVTNGTPCYAWTHNADDTWTIKWYNQPIGWDDNDLSTGNPWTGTVYVKAKEDYLGGNLIATNDGNAQIEPTGIKLVIDGTPETNWRPLEGMTPIDLPIPRVNVHNLESTGNSTTWTVYKDTTVTPAEQIRALWNNVPIEEVVSATDGGNHKVTTGAAANVGISGTGETFKLADLLTELGSTFNIDTLINGLGSGAGASVSSDPIIYNAYGHESGTITVTLKREAGTAALTQHNAETVGTPAEKYSLTVTYQPYSESTRTGKIVTNQESGYTDSTNHHNGSNGRGAEETGTIISNNTHTINVFQKGIKVTKVDRTNPTTVLPGAVFELYRVDAAGTADVSSYSLPSGTYSKVGGDLTADANGIITIDPAIPDKDTDVTDKTLYEPNVSVGATTDTAHETVFYLVEKTPPTKNGVTYSKMPGAIKFTMTLSENKGTDTSATLYDWAQIAVIAAEECGNGSVEYLTETTTGTNSDIYAYMLKNGRPTDITLIKIDKVTKNSISGAKFSLLRGSENVDLTDSALTITAINDGATVTPEDYDFNGTTIKVVTVPEGGIKIAGLVDGTYTLREVTAPAGYIITDSGKTFKTENGAIKNTDDTAHTNEATDIAFEVENEPGAALPNTGGPGTNLIYLFGLLLTSFAGTGILMKRRRRNAA